MEVISTSNHNNNNNNNVSNNWGPHYHRYSSLSLASEGDQSLAESFYTCCDFGEDYQQQAELSRVGSYGCLEDVQEEDYCPSPVNSITMDDTKDNRSSAQPATTGMMMQQSPMMTALPLAPYSQLQQQQQHSLGTGGAIGLPHHLTASRLALSSDFGVLRRPSLGVTDTPSKAASILMDRDEQRSSALSAAFRSSTTAHGRFIHDDDNNKKSIDMMDTDNDDDITMMPPIFLPVESKYKRRSTTTSFGSTFNISTDTRKRTPLPLMRLEDLADDVQLQILSFVSLEDIRRVMATNKRYRKLMFTRNAQNLWKNCFDQHAWVIPLNDKTIVVDDLSLPTAARPTKNNNHMMAARCGAPMGTMNNNNNECFSSWHQQANLSLLSSMACTQPTDIDIVQLNEYHSHQQFNSRSRRRRSRHRIHTTDGNRQPLLKYFEYHHPTVGTTMGEQQQQQQSVVQFTGRVGQGDRCVRANKAFPRPTFINTGEWMVPPSSHIMGGSGGAGGGSHGSNYYKSKRHSGGSHGSSTGGGGMMKHHGHGILDLFCRSARAVTPPRPAWRPFVAPFCSENDDDSVVHLTPRFVSYYEVSILDPTGNNNTNDTKAQASTSTTTTDCVAVGVATEAFDWHTRMPGWDEKSFGFHGDDGGLFHSSGGMIRKFGPSYGRGDVVGCGVDHVMQGIFFTLNGEFLGYGWTGLPQEILERDLYPVVGIDTNDLIHCNFGKEPFKFDLKSLIVKHEELVHQSLSLS